MVGEREGYDGSGFSVDSQAKSDTRVRSIEVTQEERELGAKTLEVFEDKIKRVHPWFISVPDRTITLLKDKRLKPDTPEDIATHRIDVTDTIDLRRLEGERLSPELAKTIAIFKFVEDYLVDYSTEILETSRNYFGISLSNHQWSNEEAEHGRADGLILSGTGSASEEEMYEMYLKQKTRPFTLKYKGEPRKSLIYGKLQERAAGENYYTVANRAKDEGAVTAARILFTVGGDEIFHSRGYDHLLRVFEEQDPEGTRRDAMEVAADFQMPAEDLMVALMDRREAIRVLRATRDVGTLSGETMRRFLERELATIGCVSEEDASEASREWMSKQKHI